MGKLFPRYPLPLGSLLQAWRETAMGEYYFVKPATFQHTFPLPRSPERCGKLYLVQRMSKESSQFETCSRLHGNYPYRQEDCSSVQLEMARTQIAGTERIHG